MTTARLDGEPPSGIRQVGLIEVPSSPGIVRRFIFDRWQNSRVAGAALAESSGLMSSDAMDLLPSDHDRGGQIEAQPPNPGLEPPEDARL